MRSKLKNWSVGAGVTGVSIASTRIFPGLSSCIGTCGACSGSCVPSVLGIVVVGMLALLNGKLKKKIAVSK